MEGGDGDDRLAGSEQEEVRERVWTNNAVLADGMAVEREGERLCARCVEPPFDFAEAYARATWAPLGSENVPVVAIDDLIAMKRGASRPRDQEDIDALLALRRRHE